MPHALSVAGGCAQHGFTTAATPWLPPDPAHAALAVDRQLADPGSTLHATRRLVELRRAHPALRRGSFEPLVADGDVLVVRRRLANADANDDLLLAFNLGATGARLPLPAALASGAPLFQHAQATTEGSTLVLPPGGVLFARAS